MATINKVIEYVDGVKPNAYDEEAKFHWMCELDGMVARLVMQLPEPPRYEFPRDMDRQLLIPAPFEAAYAQYMEAMIDYHNREYQHYNNSMQMFNATFTDFKKAYIRDNRPKSAGEFTGF